MAVFSSTSKILAAARIKRYSDDFGYFCHLSFELEGEKDSARHLVGVAVEPEYRGAVFFGIDYALSRCGYSGGWRATFTTVQTHYIDTSPEVVAWCAATAVLNAMNAEPPELDVERGVVYFRK